MRLKSVHTSACMLSSIYCCLPSIKFTIKIGRYPTFLCAVRCQKHHRCILSSNHRPHLARCKHCFTCGNLSQYTKKVLKLSLNVFLTFDCLFANTVAWLKGMQCHQNTILVLTKICETSPQHPQDKLAQMFIFTYLLESFFPPQQ